MSIIKLCNELKIAEKSRLLFEQGVKVDQHILWVHGMTYNPGYTYELKKVIKINKTSFKIDVGSKIFNIQTGNQKGLHGRTNMGRHSVCYLLNDEDKKKIEEHFKKINSLSIKKEKIKQSLNNLTENQIDQIIEIIN